MLMEALAASVSVGLGCGTCCGSSASSFLAVYILTEGGGFKSSMKHVGSYFLGKILAVCAICALTSAIGKVFIDENGMVGGFNLHHLVSWVMIASALFLIYRWFRNRKSDCKKCGGKCSAKHNARLIPSFSVGLAYGAYPCVPLTMVAGYAMLLSLPAAVLLGAAFALASSLTPMLVVFGLSGALSGKINKQLGKAMPWVQLCVYILFLIVAVVTLFCYT
ncbi:MAG: sulfite exporter TauE/SafE family protein [Ruminococcus sp.]|uniref:urease accessory protein UreH domain-containing protein n=1 Tax=Ruminococcus sp. TaxID=41978 RepID=UPI002873A790|nr:sulfite exporter TauE/SafE family protein [Ruminococcus sp.]MBQ3285844.1 sulfite exporter TauE/SafE family protein [Ruminococcus sp.]